MHNWNDHYRHGMGVGHPLIMILMVVLWALAVWALVSVIRNNGLFASRASKPRQAGSSAQQILNERLARGEISEDEFKSRSEALKSINS